MDIPLSNDEEMKDINLFLSSGVSDNGKSNSDKTINETTYETNDLSDNEEPDSHIHQWRNKRTLKKVKFTHNTNNTHIQTNYLVPPEFNNQIQETHHTKPNPNESILKNIFTSIQFLYKENQITHIIIKNGQIHVSTIELQSSQ